MRKPEKIKLDSRMKNKIKLSDFPLEEIQKAQNAVADQCARSAYKTYIEDEYAKHVTRDTKQENLEADLLASRQIRAGEKNQEFWVWQRLIYQLTGESVALLPLTKPNKQTKEEG